MPSSRCWKELSAIAVIFSLLCLALPVRPAAAAWLPSRAAAQDAKGRLVALLDREDVTRAFESRGI
ncbi:MAG: hypothetical protein HY900_13730, partial [Deltaproteobacteria bacterium]|nr:hypothetical protein [Deltaproteobacteria bacterium]